MSDYHINIFYSEEDVGYEDLEVPVVPIYIQERIHPQAIIDALLQSSPSPSGRGQGEGGRGYNQLNLFSDFNGGPADFAQKVEFYHHAEQWGRRWITCDTSRVALALARTRLMAAKYPYYLLADSPAGIKKETELTGTLTPALSQRERGEAEGRGISSDIRRGFVYKRVPHVTLKSIANNPDIKEGMMRAQIDASIAKHADTETLYDQPYEDNKRIRVCGPFSVESLSPHRVLSTADENQDGTITEQEARKQQDFVTMILENLKKTGVQNTRKAERLTFNRLDPYAGVWLNAAGEYTESPHPNPLPQGEEKKGTDPLPALHGEGVRKRVAISIGPEHGTVGPQQVKEAAKEAVQGVGFDMLIVCGFAFDPHVAEEVKRYGNLIVLPTKMNPDLAMGDELLKKTGAGNLFMVFGEPDVEIKYLPSPILFPQENYNAKLYV